MKTTTEAVFKKLRLDDDQLLLIVNAPQEFELMLKGVSYDKVPIAARRGKYDYVQVFATEQKSLEKICREMEGVGKYDCVFWGCYPKGAGSIKSDIKRETVWKAFDLIGMRPVSQVAIDETWSALRARPGKL